MTSKMMLRTAAAQVKYSASSMDGSERRPMFFLAHTQLEYVIDSEQLKILYESLHSSRGKNCNGNQDLPSSNYEYKLCPLSNRKINPLL